jgi:hypothetical protein
VEHCVADSNLLIVATVHNFEELLVSVVQHECQRLAECVLDCQQKLWLFEIVAIEEL